MGVTFSQAIKKSNTDEWYTTEGGVEIIIPFLRINGYKKILCPFDTDQSNYVKVLKRNGFEVTNSHIKTGVDFFELMDLDKYDAVVSNPPFSKREKILEKLFKSKVPFALIINFNGLFDSKKRWELFKNNKFELIVPEGRLHFFNEECAGNSPNFQSIYVCSGMCKHQIEFVKQEPDQIVMDWRLP